MSRRSSFSRRSVVRDVDTQLFRAAKIGDAEEVLQLLALGAEANARGPEHETPLHVAAYHGHAAVCEALIANGANVNALERLRGCPLHVAAARGMEDACLVLLRSGASRQVLSLKGKTAEQVAKTHSCKALIAEFEAAPDPAAGGDGGGAVDLSWEGKSATLGREGALRTWKERFVRLEERGAHTRLAVYKRTGEALALDIVRLRAATVEATVRRGAEFAWVIHQAPSIGVDEAVFIFRCKSSAERDRWIDACRKAASYASSGRYRETENATPVPPVLDLKGVVGGDEGDAGAGPAEWTETPGRVVVSFTVPAGASAEDVSVRVRKQGRAATVKFRGTAVEGANGRRVDDAAGALSKSDVEVIVGGGRAIVTLAKAADDSDSESVASEGAAPDEAAAPAPSASSFDPFADAPPAAAGEDAFPPPSSPEPFYFALANPTAKAKARERRGSMFDPFA